MRLNDATTMLKVYHAVLVILTKQQPRSNNQQRPYPLNDHFNMCYIKSHISFKDFLSTACCGIVASTAGYPAIISI